MRISFVRALSLIALLGAFGPGSLAQEPVATADAESRYAELIAAFEEEQAALLDRYRTATQEQRAGLPDLNIAPCRAMVERFAAAAGAFEGEPEAFPFLLWMVQAGWRVENGRAADPDDPLIRHQAHAIGRIMESHTRDERVGDVVTVMTQSFHIDPALYTRAIRAIERETRSDEVRARCRFALAAKATDREEREALLESAVTLAPESDVAQQARSELFEMRHLGIGSTPPDFAARTPDGDPVRLSDHRGKVVVVWFTQINCGPCRAAIPRNRERMGAHEGAAYVQLDIYTGGDSGEDVARYIEDHGVTWPVIHDEKDAASRSFYGPIGTLWNVYGTPSVYVLDEHGVIRYKHVRGEELDQCVTALLDEMG